MSDPSPQVIVFDAVGTLIKPAEDVARTYERIGRKYGSQLSRDEIRFRFQSGRQKTFGADPGQAASDVLAVQQWRNLVILVFGELAKCDRLFQELWDYYSLPMSWQVFDDVRPTLELISNSGIDVAIASNFDSRLVALCRELKPIAGIEKVFCSSEVGFAKPAAEFFSIVSVRLAVPSHQLVMVGDDFEKDVDAARRAGWQAVHVDRSQMQLAACLRTAFPNLNSDSP